MGQVDAFMTEVRGFMKSRVILTAAELDLFTRLDEKPCNVVELAKEKKLDVRATTRVLDCLVTLDLLEKQNGIYRLSENGVFFSSHHPETMLPMVLHMNDLWDSWSNLTEFIKEVDTAKQKHVERSDENWDSFIGAMHVAGRELAQQIAADYNLSNFNRLLDIGGASGTYTIAFLRHNPAMRAVIFDLGNVIPLTRKRLAEEGIDERVDLVAGDFYKDELPSGCDLALLSAIIHQNSPEDNLNLYKKVYKALSPDGTVLIRDFIMDESRTKPPEGAMFAINMLVNTRGGDTYTFEEVKEGLEKAGFANVKQVRHSQGMDFLVEGKKVSVEKATNANQ